MNAVFCRIAEAVRETTPQAHWAATPFLGHKPNTPEGNACDLLAVSQRARAFRLAVAVLVDLAFGTVLDDLAQAEATHDERC